MTITPEHQNNPSIRWNLWDAILIGAASLVFIFSGIIIIEYFSGSALLQTELSSPKSYVYVIALAALEGIGLIAGIFVLGFLRHKIKLIDLGFIKTTRSWLIKAALITFLMMPVIGLIAAFIQKILGIPINNPQLEFLVPDELSYLSAGGMLVVAGFIVPLAEELFFRGVLYQALRKHFGVWIGIFVSSIIFGALHGDISIAGATFVMGLVLAYFFEYSGSIWPSVLIHALNNSLKLAVIYIMMAKGFDISGF